MRGELSIPHRPAIAPSKTVGFLFLNLPDDATGYAHAEAPRPDGNGGHCACNYKGGVSCGKNSVRPSTRRCCGLSRALQPVSPANCLRWCADLQLALPFDCTVVAVVSIVVPW